MLVLGGVVFFDGSQFWEIPWAILQQKTAPQKWEFLATKRCFTLQSSDEKSRSCRTPRH